MANSLQAKKRARQNIKRNARNSSYRSEYRTGIKRVTAAVEDGDYDNAQAALLKAVSVLDRLAHKGIIHRNKAARHKSRLNAKVKALTAQPTASDVA